MSKKKPVGRHVDNKVRPKIPREFICLIGGTSISVNGWFTYLFWKGQHEKYVDVGGPVPRTYDNISYYVNFRVKDPSEWGMVDKLDGLDEAGLRFRGWSQDGLSRVKARGWDPADMVAQPSHTHDRYWANFVDSAIHLYGRTGHIIAPMQGVDPQDGDIVTFLVYWPAYEKRQKVDWGASPFNYIHREKWEAQPYWPTASGGVWHPPDHSAPPAHITETEQSKKQREKEKAELKKRIQEDQANTILSEDDLNFYIVMRTTGENEKGIIRRPTQPDSYREYLGWHLNSAGWRDGLLQKVVLFSTWEQCFNYIHVGTVDDDMGIHLVPSQRPPEKDIYNRPLKANYTWYNAWGNGVNVDRSKIRIHRFDFLGHSAPGGLLMDYGMNNPKGKPPEASIVVHADKLASAFTGHVLTPDALACLWGCYLGTKTDDGSTFAGKMAELFGSGAVASDVATTFEHIVDSTANLPVPTHSKNWIHFAHAAAKAAGH